MPRSIFLSHVFEDKSHADTVKGWITSGRVGAGYVAIDERKDVRQLGDPVVWAWLRARIEGAAVVLCLVGNDTHNHEWVRKELALATSPPKQVLLMRIPDTTGAAPEGFRHLPLLAFDPGALRAALAAVW